MISSGKKTILLVEDEAIIAWGRQTALEKCGYTVITTGTGEKAVELFKNPNSIDLILMDIDLGLGIDGTEAAKTILLERNIPVVLLSSHNEPEIVEKTETITSYGYVMKNSGITILDASIKMAFKLFEAQKKLEDEKEYLRTTLNSIGDAVISTDTEGNVTRMNPVAEELTGWKIQDALSLPVEKICVLIDPYTKVPVESHVKKALKGEGSFASNESSLINSKSGIEHRIIESGAPILDSSGDITGIVLVYRNVSEAYKTQEALRLRESYLSAIIENQPGLLWMKDLESRFLMVNSKYSKFRGIENPDDLAGRNDFTIWPVDLAQKHIDEDCMVIKSEKPAVTEESVPFDGGIKWFETFKSPVTDKNGSIIGTTGYSHDITERKLAEAQIIKKNEALEALNNELNATIERMEAVNDELLETNAEQNATDENLWHTMTVLKKSEAQLRTTQETTISSMAILSEFRDTDTGSHIQRTKLYVKLMLEKMKNTIPYPLDTIDLIWHSAPLHDIGKVAIPDSILLKPGKLTVEEFEIMKKHAFYGSEAIKRTQKILSENSFLNIAGEIAEFHHEKWDGTGYPHGLSGEQIPLSARIMAIADVYDACISERPYKAPIPHLDVVKIIHDGSGIHFDPELVRLFEENHEEFNRIGTSFSDVT